MTRYEGERQDKSERSAALQKQLSESRKDWSDVSQWAAVVKRHANLEALSAEALLELVDRIEVGAATVEVDYADAV